MQRDFDALRRELDDEGFEAAWAAGFGVPAEPAVELARRRANTLSR